MKIQGGKTVNFPNSNTPTNYNLVGISYDGIYAQHSSNVGLSFSYDL